MLIFGVLLTTFASIAAALDAYHPLAKSPMHRRRLGGISSGDKKWKRSMGPAWSTAPSLATSKYTTGVAAMQLTVVDTSTVLIIDKAENNPTTITTNSVKHPAWISTLNFKTGKTKALPAQTNSFCAGGSWLSNGTMISVGGNPRVNAASYYDQNGLTGIRIFNNCNDKGCTLLEYPSTVRLASARWYPAGCRLQDGSILIMGGMTEGGFNNVAATDNPTIEFFPSKSINNGLPVYSKFLHDALLSNLFPVVHLLPGGKLFVAANERAMIYDWQKSKETRLTNLPGVRVTYPYTAASALLPLTIANNWTPTVLFCGGSSIDESIPVYKQSSQQKNSRLCITMTLSAAGMKAGWVKEKQSLSSPRVMGETVLTPDGKVLILNGAQTGLAGYSNVHDPIGQSNADAPDYRGVLYDPLLAAGKRLSDQMPTSKIARMYHSVATLLPSGEIMITGSNPNEDVSTKTYKTDYSIEFLSPPYMSVKRPTYTWKPDKILFGKSFKVIVKPQKKVTEDQISIVLIDVGYHTHGVATDQKLLELTHREYDASTGQILVKSPRDGTYMAPGYVWLYVVVDGIPSEGGKVMLGDGSDPPFDKAANKNMLTKSARTHGAVIYK